MSLFRSIWDRTAPVSLPVLDTECLRTVADAYLPPRPAVPPMIAPEQLPSYELSAGSALAAIRQWACLCETCVSAEWGHGMRADLRDRVSRRAGLDALRDYLSPVQWGTLQHFGMFDVTGSAGTLFRLTRGMTGNVYQRATDGPGKVPWWTSLCCHPHTCISIEQVNLAQALAIVTDERHFVNTAHSCGTGPYFSHGCV